MMNSTPLLVGTGVACLASVWGDQCAGAALGEDRNERRCGPDGIARGADNVPVGEADDERGASAEQAVLVRGTGLFHRDAERVYQGAIGGLSGFENASVFAGECQGARRDLPRSVMVAAPLIALIYVLSTAAMLAWIPAGQVDLAAPIPQLLRAGFGSTGIGAVISVVTIAVLTVNTYAGAVAMVGMASRFPMVIGWDGLLPEWWCQLHPKYRTPGEIDWRSVRGVHSGADVSSWGADGQEDHSDRHGGWDRGPVHYVLDDVRDSVVLRARGRRRGWPVPASGRRCPGL